MGLFYNSMHRPPAQPGEILSWEAPLLVEQDPAPIVLITSADTDLQALAQVWSQLPQEFPEIRALNILALQQPVTIDDYADRVLAQARVIVVRLLGGIGYWPYGIEVLQDLVARTGATLVLLPGDDQPDLSLLERSTLPLAQAAQVSRYFAEGGVANIRQALIYLAHHNLDYPVSAQIPQPVPKAGIYQHPARERVGNTWPQVVILFYRAHYLVGNTAAIDALIESLVERQMTPVAIFLTSLRDPQGQELLRTQAATATAILNTTGFALNAPVPLYSLGTGVPELNDLWIDLDMPVLQAMIAGSSAAAWDANPLGLSPQDNAMQVALPEVDGRIIGRAISFKATQTRHPVLQTEILGYQPQGDRVAFVADWVWQIAHLARTPIEQRRLALVLANYPNRDGRLANGVGLDTPASTVAILQALQAAGYHTTELPADGAALIAALTRGITNDPEGLAIRPVYQELSLADYRDFLATLPSPVVAALNQRWGEPIAPIPIAGIQLGHVFVGIQPSRGCDLDPSLNYHAPDLEPTHAYLGFYAWLRYSFRAQAVVHVGKHGNLEWLPGKAVALSDRCYPEIALGPLPHFYPFIVNDPGEGAQAKRRTQAVIIDHLTPPLTRAELYGDLQTLENWVDEYYEALSLNPGRLGALQGKILELLGTSQLDQDLGLTDLASKWSDGLLNHLDRSLCDIKEAQIRDGLHILGQCPQGEQLRDLLIAIARSPQEGYPGLLRALAQDYGDDFDPLTTDPALPYGGEQRTVAQRIAGLEAEAQVLVQGLIDGVPVPAPGVATAQMLAWIDRTVLPALKQTDREITNLLHGLNGGYVPSGPSGAPTRGRAEVLPTGRNFYSVDIRAVPTESAWDVGRRAAEAAIERYTQDEGDYPRTLGLSVWGTATMRTGGDDIAQALALLGVRPVWDGAARRVIDVEVLPLSALGRPRVDVTLRVSGFFRDAFANLIALFDRAVALVAALEEPPDQNPLAARVQQESQDLLTQGVAAPEALRRSLDRVFGSPPGTYGAGLQGLIDSQNWSDPTDLAQAYINWSGYAYRGDGQGVAAAASFQRRLAGLEIVLHNQDNREHDLLDSDDYYQFQGGLAAAVKLARGEQPQVYFGDHGQRANPKVHSLAAEVAKVYRSRVVNPKWIAGVMRHGYKGAAEMAATVDFLFGYDATTNCVADHMYAGVARAYVLDPQVGEFLRRSNPWAARDMADRLLEAHQRGLWLGAEPQLLEQLRSASLAMEGEVEKTLLP